MENITSLQLSGRLFLLTVFAVAASGRSPRKGSEKTVKWYLQNRRWAEDIQTADL